MDTPDLALLFLLLGSGLLLLSAWRTAAPPRRVRTAPLPAVRRDGSAGRRRVGGVD